MYPNKINCSEAYLWIVSISVHSSSEIDTYYNK